MKFRLGLILSLALFASLAHAQTDNSIHVKAFPGATVGDKVTNAQKTCAGFGTLPCVLVIDASLAGTAPGTIPTLCATCYLADYRTSPFSGGGGGGGGGSIFPSNMRLTIDGASRTAGVNTQGDIYISAQSPGSGYSGTGTCTVNGGTHSVLATCGAYVTPQGGIAFSLTNFGSYTVVPTSISISGFTGGSGASATPALYPSVYANPWPIAMQTMTALAGKVASTHNYAVGGTVVSDALTRFTTNSYASICANTSFSEFFLLGEDLAYNSIVNGSLSAVQTYQQWVAMTHSLKTAGCTVIVSTIAKTNINATVAQIRALDDFNKLVRGGIRGVDYDYVIDFGAQVLNQFDNEAFDFIGIHYTQAGQLQAAHLADQSLSNGGFPGVISAPFDPQNYPGNIDAANLLSDGQVIATGGALMAEGTYAGFSIPTGAIMEEFVANCCAYIESRGWTTSVWPSINLISKDSAGTELDYAAWSPTAGAGATFTNHGTIEVDAYTTDNGSAANMAYLGGVFYLQTGTTGQIILNQVSGATFMTLTSTLATLTTPLAVGSGSNTVFRCATAGATLPVGSLTIASAACGTTADTGLRIE